jgi:hypothetical protein
VVDIEMWLELWFLGTCLTHLEMEPRLCTIFFSFGRVMAKEWL